MGTIRHDAIIVTTWNEDHLKQARTCAINLDLPVTEPVESFVNGYWSFLIAPDGSKEEWDASKKADKARAGWIEWARSSKLYLDWIHVSYGGDYKDLRKIEDWAGDDPDEGL